MRAKNILLISAACLLVLSACEKEKLSDVAPITKASSEKEKATSTSVDSSQSFKTSVSWSYFGSGMTDICANEKGDIWAIGNVPEAGGYGIFQYNGYKFVKQSGAGVAIDIDSKGVPYVLDNVGGLWKRSGDHWAWVSVPNRVFGDVSIGADDQIYLTTKDNKVETYQYQKWADFYTFERPGKTSSNFSFMYSTTSTFDQVYLFRDLRITTWVANGLIQDMSVATNGDLYWIDGSSTYNQSKDPGGMAIRRYNAASNTTEQLNGAANKIDVGNHKVYVVNSKGVVYTTSF